jgi:error-prone DNA polymerase
MEFLCSHLAPRDEAWSVKDPSDQKDKTRNSSLFSATSLCGPRFISRSEMATFPMPYIELHCKSNFSFLEGASHAEELAEQAAKLGYAGLAVTDRQTLAGIVRAHIGAKEHNIPLIVGAELHPIDAPSVVIWAMNRRGYGRLSRLLTIGRRRAAKGECSLTIDVNATRTERR